MRKLFFKFGIVFISVTLLTLSCSKESETDNNNLSAKVTQNEVEIAKKLYEDMTKTTDYKDFRNSAKAYADKMNMNVVILATKAQYIEWIGANMAKTKFTSIQQFTLMFDDVINKQSILTQKNADLYNYLEEADQKERLAIMQPGLATPPTLAVTGGCAAGCMDDCESDMIANDYVRSLNYGLGFSDYANGVAEGIYWSQMNWIIGMLNSCLAGC